MKSFSSLLIVTTLSVSIFACKQPIDKSLLIGEWKGAQWLIEGQTADYDATSTFFSFQEGGTYTYRYADMEEKGTYYINSKELFTTPEGGMKMMVKIEKLT